MLVQHFDVDAWLGKEPASKPVQATALGGDPISIIKQQTAASERRFQENRAHALERARWANDSMEKEGRIRWLAREVQNIEQRLARKHANQMEQELQARAQQIVKRNRALAAAPRSTRSHRPETPDREQIIADLNGRINQLQSDNERLATDVRTYQEQLHEAQSQSLADSGLQQQLSNAKVEVVDKDTKLATLAEQFSKAKKKLSHKNTTISKLNDELSGAQCVIGEKETLISRFREKLVLADNQSDSKDAKILSLEEQLSIATQGFGDNIATIAALENQLSDVNVAITARDNEILNLQSQINSRHVLITPEIEEAVRACCGEFEECDSIFKLHDFIVQWREDYNSLGEAYKTLSTDADALREQTASLTEKKESAERKLQKTPGYARKVKMLEAKLVELNTERLSALAEIDRVTSQNTRDLDEIERLEDHIGSCYNAFPKNYEVNTLDKLQDAVKSMQSEIERLNLASLSQHPSTGPNQAELLQAANTHATEMRQLHAQNTALTKRVKNAKKERDAYVAARESTHDRTKRLQAQKAAEDEIKSLEEKVATLEKEKKDREDAETTLESARQSSTNTRENVFEFVDYTGGATNPFSTGYQILNSVSQQQQVDTVNLADVLHPGEQPVWGERSSYPVIATAMDPQITSPYFNRASQSRKSITISNSSS
jgi:chromosome segregation ATPase